MTGELLETWEIPTRTEENGETDTGNRRRQAGACGIKTVVWVGLDWAFPPTVGRQALGTPLFCQNLSIKISLPLKRILV